MMNESRLNFVFILVIAAACWIGMNKSTNPVIDGGTPHGCSTEEITDMYAEYIEQWKQEVKTSFDQAEREVLKTNPTPDVVGPDPDPNKCICGGSGWIKQGDGHKTKCPYHGQGMGDILKKNGLIIYKH
tara:strand:+ start:1102 stop:1488 length:387 start_codon:yes stop_codon:yes gene_type:complete